jgi:hypothetical protein
MNPFFNVRLFSNEYLISHFYSLTIKGCAMREYGKVYDEIARRKKLGLM